MAENNKDNVSLGKGKVSGIVYWAPEGTELPKNATDDLPAGYENVGYISEDGVTNSADSDTASVQDANGVTVLSAISSYSESNQFTMIETNENSMKLRYGQDAVTSDAQGMTVRHRMPTGVPIRLIFEFLLNGDRPMRDVVPNATISDFDDIQHDSGDVLGYSVTYTSNPAAELGGDLAVTYIAGRKPTTTPAKAVGK